MIPFLRALIVAAAFLALTIPLMPIQWLMRALRLDAAKLLPHYYHKFICKLLSINISVEGGEVAGAALIVANHVSWLDIPVLSALQPVSFIAKHEVGTWPFFGSLARLQNCIFVNRAARHLTGEAKQVIGKRLAEGDAIVLFAEGTSGNGRLAKRFKSSLLGAVEQQSVPVVPLTLVYKTQQGLPLTMRQRPAVAWYGSMDLLPHLWNFLLNGPLSVNIFVHPAAPCGDRKVLSAQAEGQIRAALAQALHGGSKIG